MTSVFAVQVRSGLETKAKDMLEYVFNKTNETIINGIYALESYTKVVSDKTEDLNNDSAIGINDLSSHIEKEQIASSISSLRSQLDGLNEYSSIENAKRKVELRKSINKLEKQKKELGQSSRSIQSVIKGYILVELKGNSISLPNRIWHSIKSVPLVSEILSTTPIPQEEMKIFMQTMEDKLIPQVEMEFGEEVAFEEVAEKQSDLLDIVNAKSTNQDTKVRIGNAIDNLTNDVVEKVKEYVRNKPTNPYLSKIKAFVKRSKRVVSMPLHYMENLYTEDELTFIGKRLNAKDFMNRLIIYEQSQVDVM